VIRRAALLTLALASLTCSLASAAPSPLATQEQAVAAAVRVTSVPASALQGIALDPLDEPINLPLFASCKHESGNCLWPNGGTTRTVVLLGDSHAYMWSPAVELALKPLHIRVVLLWLLGCPAANLRVWGTFSNPNTPDTTCTTWRTKVWRQIDAMKPAAVILSERTYQTFAAPHQIVTDAAWRTALIATIQHFQHVGSRVVILGDIPAHANFVSPPQCLAAHPSHIAACAAPVSGQPAAWQARPQMEASAAAAAGATFLDTTPWLCARGICPAIIGDQRVYMDWSHLRAHYTESLTPIMAQVLLPALGLRS
jgi:SGNH domain (fused to AT3 domains)